MVEHSAVNRRVVGSSPTRGATKAPKNWGFSVYMAHYIYILKSKTADKYYIGSSENPERRLEFHNTIEKGFTARNRPWEIVFTQEFTSKTVATKVERKIKSWKSRKMIERVINREIVI